MRMTICNKQQQRKRGMVLIVAMIISAIVLLLGINMSNIAMKEIYLTSFSKESQTALFMADSMLECVLYWDVVNTSGDATLPAGVDSDGKYYFPPPLGGGASTQSISCLESSILGSSQIQSTGGNPSVSTFGILPKAGGGVNEGPSYKQPCAQVTITKTDISPTEVQTVVQAQGYNTCDNTNPRRTQRGLEVIY